MILPSTRVPGRTSCMRFRQRRKVDFPQPEGPIKAVTSLARKVIETSLIACVLPYQAFTLSAMSETPSVASCAITWRASACSRCASARSAGPALAGIVSRPLASVLGATPTVAVSRPRGSLVLIRYPSFPLSTSMLDDRLRLALVRFARQCSAPLHRAAARREADEEAQQADDDDQD